MKIDWRRPILSSNFAQLRNDALQAIEGGGNDFCMWTCDGHFVRTLRSGPPVVKSLRKAVKVPLDCHLMIENPDLFLPAEFGSDRSGFSSSSGNPRHLHRLPQTLHHRRSHVCSAQKPVHHVHMQNRSAPQ